MNDHEKDKMSVHKMNCKKEIIQQFPFKPRVLVVDDEERIQTACCRLLTDEGCDVQVAENGIMGLEMIEENHFDIILVDLMMPGMSGMDVLSDVKSRHPDTVVIIITGYATIEHSIEAMKKGAFDFLSKPFSPGELRQCTSKAIDFLQTLQDIVTEKSRMRVMINTLNNGVLTTDNQKRIALANPVFLKAINCKKKAVIGQSVASLGCDSWLMEMIDKAIDQSSTVFEEITKEIILPTSKSDVVIWGVRCIPFRDRLNRTLGSITVFHDITETKKKDQSKSDFVSMVAHEINSPLNSVLMQLNVILDGLAGDLTAKQTDILNRSSDRIKSLTTLSSELLDLSKIESGLINQDRQELDLTALVEEQVKSYQETAKSKSVVLTLKKSPSTKKIMGNQINIEEVVSNLISNAIRYSSENGWIRVGIKEITDSVQIVVEDNGMGIPQKDLLHIFDRFFRVKNEQTRFINGTGLGLSIVKSIVDAHHGSIEVQSTEGEGTIFKVDFPNAEYKI